MVYYFLFYLNIQKFFYIISFLINHFLIMYNIIKNTYKKILYFITKKITQFIFLYIF